MADSPAADPIADALGPADAGVPPEVAARDVPIAKPVKDAKPERRGGVKETIEQILVAFILAFIFRAYVVEAFVIPTGSMAPTLLGAHLRYDCPDCGYDFAVNYGAEGGDDDMVVPRNATVRERTNRGQLTGRLVDRTYSVACPNCGYRLPKLNPADPANDATAPPVHFGDRILVLKYLYLLNEPARWDVVVFKNPSGRQASADPATWQGDYTQNYIKRLAGLPGETVMVLDGDVYTARATGDPAALRPGDFTIRDKPHARQEALWRIVYDADHPPQGLPRGVQVSATQLLAEPAFENPWRPAEGSGWDQTGDGGRTFTFSGESSGTLAFAPDANPLRVYDQGLRARPFFVAPKFTDWLGYDQTVENENDRSSDQYLTGGYDRGVPTFTVSDAKLDLFYTRRSGDGPLRLTLTKDGVTFVATLAPSGVTLTMRREGGQPLVVGGGSASVDLSAGRARRVEFANADHRVSVRVDGREVVATTPAEYAPDVAGKLADFRSGREGPKPSVSIAAENQSAVLRHVRLYRDVYYTNVRRKTPRLAMEWASPEDFPNGLVTLGPTDYFVLGDNSLISGDARTWTHAVSLPYEGLEVPAGRVPERFLLGKAFFVYWPAGFRPIPGLGDVVPNVGAMRLIH